jgi:hypothetical protein
MRERDRIQAEIAQEQAAVKAAQERIQRLSATLPGTRPSPRGRGR